MQKVMDIGGNPMTKTQAEIVTSVRQRRRWSRAEKERIVAAAMEPGAVASAVGWRPTRPARFGFVLPKIEIWLCFILYQFQVLQPRWATRKVCEPSGITACG